MRIILLVTGIVLSLALGLQTHAFGIFETAETAELANLTDESLPIVKKSITLNTGIRMKYVEAGNPNGRTLLFLHGYTDTSRSFEKVIETLLKKDPGLRLIAPNLRGHGESSIPNPSNSNAFGIDDFAADILDFMKLKKIAKVDLIGHSMGSVIAQEIALEHPNKVTSLTMIGAFVNGKKNNAIQDFLMPELIAKWKQQLKHDFGKDWKIESFHLTPKDLGTKVTSFLRENWVTEADCDTSLLESIYLETIEVPLATWFGALEALSEMDNSERMKRLKVPAQIIWGAGDDFTSKSDQDRLRSACEAAYKRNATPIQYKNYNGDGIGNNLPGHNLHWANAEKVALDILEFFGSESPFIAEVK